MDIQLTEYECTAILVFLESYVSEYGSKDWPLETKNAVKSIFQKLKADENTCRFIGGILK